MVPVTLLWRHPDGTTGRRGCAGFVAAMDHASRMVAAAGVGSVLRARGAIRLGRVDTYLSQRMVAARVTMLR